MTRPLRAAGAIAALGLAACSGSGTSPQNNTVAKVSANVLELGVGTANIFGDEPGSNASGINVAVSYRQPTGAFNPGASATLVNEPTLSLPSNFGLAAGSPAAFDATSTIVTGPAPGEVNQLTSTPQNATSVTSFGVTGGAFGLGLEPFNYNGNGVPTTNVPYPVPLFDALSATFDPNQFEPWGGPPAFDPNKDGLGVRDGNVYPAGVLGISEGLDVLEGVPVTTGTYGLSVGVTGNTGTTTQTASASLTSSALLPAITPAVPALDASGGGTFAVTLPAGVTEAYVQITDYGPDTDQISDATPQLAGCNTASDAAPVYYTFEVTASGTVTLPDSIGPGTKSAPTPSICTAAQNSTATMGATVDADDYSVQTIGFDYPAFEASYPNSLGKPSPTLTGANGQSDITISSQLFIDNSTGGGDDSIARKTHKRHAHTHTKAVLRRI